MPTAFESFIAAGMSLTMNWTTTVPIAGMALTVGIGKASRVGAAWLLFSLWAFLYGWNIFFPQLVEGRVPSVIMLMWLPYLAALIIVGSFSVGAMIPRRKRVRRHA